MAQLKSTSVTGNLSVTGNVVASQIMKLDGTNDQLLRADGGVQYISALTNDIKRALTIANNALSKDDGGVVKGNITLQGGESQDSPALIFQRGELADDYNDWKVYDAGGNLYFQQRGLNSTEWNNIFILNQGGGATIYGGPLIPTTNATHSGIKLGNTYLTAIDGNVIFQNNNAIRFGTDDWDYNQWAGLKYDHSKKTIYLGLADNTIFTANAAQSGGIIRTPGVEKINIDGGKLALSDKAIFEYNTDDKCIDVKFN